MQVRIRDSGVDEVLLRWILQKKMLVESNGQIISTSCRQRIRQYLAAFFLLGKISQKVKFKIEVIFDCQTEKIYIVKIFRFLYLFFVRVNQHV